MYSPAYKGLWDWLLPGKLPELGMSVTQCELRQAWLADPTELRPGLVYVRDPSFLAEVPSPELDAFRTDGAVDPRKKAHLDAAWRGLMEHPAMQAPLCRNPVPQPCAARGGGVMRASLPLYIPLSLPAILV